jgi:hypothetical protein
MAMESEFKPQEGFGHQLSVRSTVSTGWQQFRGGLVFHIKDCKGQLILFKGNLETLEVDIGRG